LIQWSTDGGGALRTITLVATVPVALLGVGLGFGAGRWLKQPALQSLVACLAAWALASIVATAMWLISPPFEAEVLAVAWQLPKLLVVLGIVGRAALGAHSVLGAVAGSVPAVLAWRPVLLGLVGALAGFWGYPRGAGLGEPLR
jgi:hypothetical protein